tara:strand:+ start:467 stop:889 length:423 start_codon:yes stop_codon:yes gene_type:complete
MSASKLKNSFFVLWAIMLTVLHPHPSQANDSSTCPENADGIAAEVKTILGTPYKNGITTPSKSHKAALQELLVNAGHCAAVARSFGTESNNRHQNIMEWHAINQWLDRLVSFVHLNEKGDLSINWRQEYEIFAEVYEFEP